VGRPTGVARPATTAIRTGQGVVAQLAHYDAVGSSAVRPSSGIWTMSEPITSVWTETQSSRALPEGRARLQTARSSLITVSGGPVDRCCF
jgi:hypothetical protein